MRTRQLNKIYDKILIPDIKKWAKECTDEFETFEIEVMSLGGADNPDTGENDLSIKIDFRVTHTNDLGAERIHIVGRDFYNYERMHGLLDMVCATTEYVFPTETFHMDVSTYYNRRLIRKFEWWSDGQRKSYIKARDAFINSTCI